MTTVATEAAPNDFAALIAEMEPLAKAMPAADCDADGKPKRKGKDGEDTVQAAAADGAANSEGADGNGEGDGAEGEEPFGKAFKVTLEDGTETEAFDGTAMMKALHGQVETLAADRDGMFKALSLSMQGMKVLRETVEAQDGLIKSLQADVAKVGSTGAGRRSALTVLDKVTTTAPGKPEAIRPGEFMAKAMDLQAKGTLDALGVARCEAHLNRTGQLPGDLAHLFAG